jgi:N-methylhydantoinase A
VNFRLLAIGRLRQPATPPAAPRQGAAPKAGGERKVWFTAEQAQATPVYDRATLLPGDAIPGPALIEQLDSTTLLFPGDRATVDPYLNLIVELAA